MKLWGQKSEAESQPQQAAGGSFEEAAARVSAESPEVAAGVGAPVAAEEGDSLAIRPEWAEAAARLCFLPAARLSHPAYSLTDEEAEHISPKMQAFLQAVADKYAPAMLGRVANKYPEFFDLTAALGVLYWQKWRYVSKLQQWEAERAAAERQQAKERAEAEGFAASAVASVELPPDPPPARPKAGERDKDGVLVI